MPEKVVRIKECGAVLREMKATKDEFVRALEKVGFLNELSKTLIGGDRCQKN
jgi:hypothetical protein